MTQGRDNAASAALGVLLALAGLAGPGAALTDGMPAGSNVFANNVCLFLGGSTYNDATAASRNTQPNDVTLGQGLQGTGVDAVYVGAAYAFTSVVVDVSTVGSGSGVAAWEYLATNGAWKPLADVEDGTDSFKNLGVATVHFAVPEDWSATSAPASCGTGSHFYVRASSTSHPYSSFPLGRQIGIVLYNLHVDVTNDVGVFDGLPASAFVVTSGTDNAPKAFRTLAGRGYEFALMTTGDFVYQFQVSPEGFAPTAPVSTGAMDATLKTLALAVAYPLRVTVAGAAGDSLPDAVVKVGGRAADAHKANAFYFKGALEGALTVTAPGRAPADPKVDTMLQHVQGTTAGSPTSVSLVGGTPCAAATSVAAGATATCRGLSATSPTSGSARRASAPASDLPSSVGDEPVVDGVAPSPFDGQAAVPALPVAKWVLGALTAAGLVIAALVVFVAMSRRARK